MKAQKKIEYKAASNACKQCSPLGASFVFRGIERSIPLLHGSQGCSTYIRRYLISHFNEPVDIACSNFTEETAVFGGGANLKLAVENIIKQYNPELIGIATTCLSETIGEDVPMILKGYNKKNFDENFPEIVSVSTPSFSGTHIDGFHGAVRAVVDSIAVKKKISTKQINIFPGMLSPADLRHLKEIVSDFSTNYAMLPDYSDTFDGPLWTEYQEIPEGGTKIEKIASMGDAVASIEFGKILAGDESAGKLLESRLKPVPEKYIQERGRLIDAYADGPKYVFEARAVVYGEEDLVIGLASFLSEVGIIPIICASGGESGLLRQKILDIIPDAENIGIRIIEGADFVEIGEEARKIDPDFFIGNSKGYKIAREMKKPLIRVGFPIHDRLGGARIIHVGYRGAQQLFDIISNTIIATRQDTSPVGYTYM
jgi:nitrogenase molybdenum-iron protein NifN